MGWVSTIAISLLKTHIGKHGVGVEIGVATGANAFAILDAFPKHTLYLVDPWKSGYSTVRDSNDVNQQRMDGRYKSVCSTVQQRYSERATVIRKPSVEAAAEVPDNLDYIFIDGNHAYEAVLQDLNTWVHKVRANGLVIGDDWGYGWNTVVAAVIDFCEKENPFLPPVNKVQTYKPIPSKRVSPAPRNAPIVNKVQKLWWGIKR